MKKIITIIVLIATISLARAEEEEIAHGAPWENRCMIDAVICKASKDLTHVCVWSRVLIIDYTFCKESKGHAYCVYEYPAGSGNGWAYDIQGTEMVKIPGDIKQLPPLKIAQKLMHLCHVDDAYWADDINKTVRDSVQEPASNNTIENNTLP